ncbi:MAG: hybrid sensor histidine kinase/response regulator [Candidatus Rokubacteria bacterium]|nr:hybrid sensor histidine kinase/response regulator [Candidatus Rokubacteria bacterium]
MADPVASGISTATVLIVDDHRYVRDMVRALFEGDSYRVLEAGDGETGLEIARTQRPDCVLLDVRMPGLSGFEVLARLSADPRTREIPVIMLSAIEDTLEGLERALSSGAVDYLAKPVAPARVAARVRGAIERRRLLQEVQELRANFTSMLVHDLRSPITVVNAYVDMLGQGGAGPVTDRQRQLLGRIQESCGRMVRLIGEILDLSKLEAGKLRLERRPLDLDAQAAEVVERFGLSARDKSIELTFRALASPCRVFADEGRIDQVLMNLLGNALKFTPRGGAIKVEVGRLGDDVELSVRDTGPGIPADELPLIFERFRQGTTTHATQSPGSGLGLVICRHLVEAHGGRIWAQSEPGRGSRFVFRLPAATD